MVSRKLAQASDLGLEAVVTGRDLKSQPRSSNSSGQPTCF